MSAEQFRIRKDSPMGQPAQVRKARMNGDSAALSAMGRKGAEHTNAKRARDRAEEEMLAIQRAEEHLERQTEANEHIAPLD